MDSDEIVYGSNTRDDSHVMSERVQTLAASVYQEFERMIKKYDEDVVKELMPLVVGILETLDNSFLEKQETDVELELLRDDNEQLLTQYEREKQLRKGVEQKYLEAEDTIEDERREFQNKTENVDSLVRMLELKARNSADHVSRLEDKETEMKKEYTKLHERYTELLRTHMDHIERTKMFMGTDKILELGASPRNRGFQMPNLRPVPSNTIYSSITPDKGDENQPMFPQITSPRGQDTNTSLRHELKDLEKGEVEEKLASKEDKEMRNKSIDVETKTETAEKEQNTDFVDLKTTSTCMKDAVDSSKAESSQSPVKDSDVSAPGGSKKLQKDRKLSDESEMLVQTNLKVMEQLNLTVSQQDLATHKAAYSIGIKLDPEDLEEETQVASADSLQSPESDAEKSEPVGITGNNRMNDTSIFDELSMEDAHALGDVDDGCDITGMSKEVENLILENTELLATKNALNIVKDDLIAKVDELTSEQEILREEITALQGTKEKLKKRVTELEDELKKMKEDLEKEKNKKGGENEEDQEEVPMSQRKRFTRVEMARVLMERNQYKERLMELQEAVRWTEMIRASREHPDLVKDKKKGSIWNFFGGLVGGSGGSSSQQSSTPSPKPQKGKVSKATVV